jgi:small subunit ribosomal protein S11
MSINTKKIIKKKKTKLKDVQGILNISSTFNNVIFTYTDMLGKPLYWYSCGCLPNIKKKKGLRSKYLTILEAITTFSNKLKNNNVKTIIIKLNGVGLLRKTLFKGLKSYKFTVYKIYNKTSVPHNGCRPKKYRRL